MRGRTTGGGAHSPRGALAVMCVIAALLGMAMGHENGVDWFADALPERSEATAQQTTPPPAGTDPAGTAGAIDGADTGTDPAWPAAAREAAPMPTPEHRPAARAPGALSIAAVGDTMMGSAAYGLPPDGGASFFSQVDHLLSGDLVLANLEGTFSTTTDSKCPTVSEDSDDEERRRAANCFAFQSPPEYARHMAAAGVTVANLANNHSNDFGPGGRDETVAALEDVGIAHTGLAGTRADIEAAGANVVVLGFAPYDWADPLLDIDAAAERVRQTGRTADIVVVTFHGGAEGVDATHVPDGPETYLGEQRGNLRRFSRAMVDAGADLVVGHGPHVLRGMEVYRGRMIAYSLGNFGGYGSAFNLRGPLSVSMVLRVVLEPDGSFRQGRIHPTVLTDDGTPAPGGEAIEMVRELSLEDFGASAPRIEADGAVLPPT